MRIALTFLLLLTLSTHWHHKEQQRVREYVSLRADQPDAIAQASEHFDMSIEDVQSILKEAKP